MILALAGCVGKLPFINEPPRLLTVNGVGVDEHDSVALPPAEPGEALALDIVAKDPEGHDFGIWFPGAPGTVEFDPYETSGVIVLTEEVQTTYLTLELRDEHDPPVAKNYYLALGYFESTYYEGYYADSAVDSGL